MSSRAAQDILRVAAVAPGGAVPPAAKARGFVLALHKPAGVAAPRAAA